jgi:hypothetical protein
MNTKNNFKQDIRLSSATCCHVYGGTHCEYLWVLIQIIGFISTWVTNSLLVTSNTALSLIYTVVHALQFSVSTSRLLATDRNTETSTSNHYEVILPFLVQSFWNLGTQLKTLLDSSSLQADSCYIAAARKL